MCSVSNHQKVVRFMGKKSKSKRFIQHGKISVEKHAKQFPYRSTFEEAENAQSEKSGVQPYQL